MSKKSESALQVLQSQFSGVLSTHSQAYPGYPFGSVVPYCLSESGVPLILISALAQHTKNIQADSKVSLTLLESKPGNVQQAERLTLLADAVAVEGDAVENVALRYYSHFPDAQGYHTDLDFVFYQLQPVQFRYIEGFGKINWLAPESLVQPSPFDWQRESGMVTHMNEDHADAIAHYCDLYKIPYKAQPVMCSVRGEGMVLRVDEQLHWLEFPEIVTTSKEAREALVALARKPLE